MSIYSDYKVGAVDEYEFEQATAREARRDAYIERMKECEHEEQGDGLE